MKRLSDSEDRIPVMVSERLVDVTQDYVGEYVEIHGQFRSYNRHEEKHNRLVLSAFARELQISGGRGGMTAPVNQIFLDGYICKPPVYRKTPAGKGNRGPPSGCKPPLWEIRLHTLYLLGTKCPLRICL